MAAMREQQMSALRLHDKILCFLDELRDSFDGAERVFTYGSCFRLYRMLKILWPEAECWYDGDHAITKIGGKFYDITGETVPYKHIPIDEIYSPLRQKILLSHRYGEKEAVVII